MDASQLLTLADTFNQPWSFEAFEEAFSDTSSPSIDDIFLPLAPNAQHDAVHPTEVDVKRMQRKLKNKQSAHESRRRRKQYLAQVETKNNVLTQEVVRLQQANQSLQAQLASLKDVIQRREAVGTDGKSRKCMLMMMLLAFSVPMTAAGSAQQQGPAQVATPAVPAAFADIGRSFLNGGQLPQGAQPFLLEAQEQMKLTEFLSTSILGSAVGPVDQIAGVETVILKTADLVSSQLRQQPLLPSRIPAGK